MMLKRADAIAPGDYITTEVLNRADPRWGEKLDATVTKVTDTSSPEIIEVWWNTGQHDPNGVEYFGAMGLRRDTMVEVD